MEVNKKQLADIFGASIRTIQNWQEQGMPVLRGGGKGNEVLYDSAAVIKWYAERDAEIENEKLRREVEELRQASEADQTLSALQIIGVLLVIGSIWLGQRSNRTPRARIACRKSP
jgi:phage terminase Nu1 subunit (DNA packaging protein)